MKLISNLTLKMTLVIDIPKGQENDVLNKLANEAETFTENLTSGYVKALNDLTKGTHCKFEVIDNKVGVEF